MFTGIIRELGTVARLERSKGVLRLSVTSPKLASYIQPLESVAVDGVCLTVVAIRGSTMAFDVIQETQRLTTLGRLRPGDRVHLEPSLSVADRLGGHFLFGHVDGDGLIVKRRQLAGELVLTIRVRPALRKFLVPKGPVAIDGVSLTVGATMTSSSFTVHLIPETQRQTMLRERAVGERVNIEIDYLAKLVRQFLRPIEG